MCGVWVDTTGVIYVSDFDYNVIRKIDTQGIISLFAGTGAASSTGDGGAPTAAAMNLPSYIWGNTLGNLYVSEANGYRVRLVVASIVTTYAGTGAFGDDGEGCSRTSATFKAIAGIMGDSTNNIYVVDKDSFVVRMISPSGIVTRFCGTYTSSFNGNLAATSTNIVPCNVFVGTDYVLIAELSGSVRKVFVGSGSVAAFAGSSVSDYCGDGGPATSACLTDPRSAYVDGSGNVFVVTYSDNRLRQITSAANIYTVAGNGQVSNAGADGSPAISSGLAYPISSWSDTLGAVYVSSHSLLRKLVNINPTATPTRSPTQAPTTTAPSMVPTTVPSVLPSRLPTVQPTLLPSTLPTVVPSIVPPSLSPSQAPSYCPSVIPTMAPCVVPSIAPTISSIVPSVVPSLVPTAVPSLGPSVGPTLLPSSAPSVLPTAQPTVLPSVQPTVLPSAHPSSLPTIPPSVLPTLSPTVFPTLSPTVVPTTAPSVVPSFVPSYSPSLSPTIVPSVLPSLHPSTIPSITPTLKPTAIPALVPTVYPSNSPSELPSIHPSSPPSVVPSATPSDLPTMIPSEWPSELPSESPTIVPSETPTEMPVMLHPLSQVSCLASIPVKYLLSVLLLYRARFQRNCPADTPLNLPQLVLP